MNKKPIMSIYYEGLSSKMMAILCLILEYLRHLFCIVNVEYKFYSFVGVEQVFKKVPYNGQGSGVLPHVHLNAYTKSTNHLLNQSMTKVLKWFCYTNTHEYLSDDSKL